MLYLDSFFTSLGLFSGYDLTLSVNLLEWDLRRGLSQGPRKDAVE